MNHLIDVASGISIVSLFGGIAALVVYLWAKKNGKPWKRIPAYVMVGLIALCSAALGISAGIPRDGRAIQASHIASAFMFIGLAETVVAFVLYRITKAINHPQKRVAGLATVLFGVLFVIGLILYGVFSPSVTECDHVFSVVKQDPTCMSKGYEEKVCQKCAKIIQTTEIPATGHDSHTTQIQPTCTTAGSEKEVCRSCRKVIRQESIPALGHSMKEISRIEPSYTETGKIETRCIRCSHVETEYIQEAGTPTTAEYIGSFLFVGLIALVCFAVWFFKHLPSTPILRPKSVTDELARIDSLDGHQFEHYFASLLRAYGFENVSVTQGSGDYGVDIIAYAGEDKIAIQCKHYAKPVGIKAVQEVYAGKAHYNAVAAAVITNNYFTDAARTLAAETDVQLWDRDTIGGMILDIIQKQTPDTTQNTQTK